MTAERANRPLHSERCKFCARERSIRDEYIAQRLDTWNTAAALIKSLGSDEPLNPDHVLSLCEFLEGDQG